MEYVAKVSNMVPGIANANPTLHLPLDVIDSKSGGTTVSVRTRPYRGKCLREVEKGMDSNSIMIPVPRESCCCYVIVIRLYNEMEPEPNDSWNMLLVRLHGIGRNRRYLVLVRRMSRTG